MIETSDAESEKKYIGNEKRIKYENYTETFFSNIHDSFVSVVNRTLRLIISNSDE